MLSLNYFVENGFVSLVFQPIWQIWNLLFKCSTLHVFSLSHTLFMSDYFSNSQDHFELSAFPPTSLSGGFLSLNVKIISSNAVQIQQICRLSHNSENTGEAFVKPHLKLVCRLILYTKAE